MGAIDFVVLSSREGLLGRLRESCPARRFVTPSEVTESLHAGIVDSSWDGEAMTGLTFASRIVLCDTLPFPEQRHPGDFRVLASEFETRVDELLSWCEEFALNQHRLRELEQEVDLSRQVQALMTEVELSGVAERIAGTILDLLSLPNGTLLLYDSAREKFVNVYSNDPSYKDSDEYLPGVPHAMLDGPQAFAVSKGERGKPRLVALPARMGEDLIGVFRGVIPPGELFDEKKAELAALFLQATTAVLSNFNRLTRSAELAMCDDLTKAFNRRFFDSYLDQEIERSRRYGSGFSIIFLDLDDLKEVNNRYGHLTGSRTLQEVAKRVLGAVRAIDKVVRFGGDEFCIILPQTDHRKAEGVADRVRRAICDAPFDLGPGISVEITASFGIATYPQHASAKEDLIRVADSAMYAVKSTTKNAIKVAGS